MNRAVYLTHLRFKLLMRNNDLIDEVNWIAMDASGDVWGYQNKPCPKPEKGYFGEWNVNDKLEWKITDVDFLKHSHKTDEWWQDSLVSIKEITGN